LFQTIRVNYLDKEFRHLSLSLESQFHHTQFDTSVLLYLIYGA